MALPTNPTRRSDCTFAPFPYHRSEFMAQLEPVKKSSPLLIGVAWLIVIIPTAWGLNYTVQNALKLFTAPTPAAAAPAK
jgi:hypothetical protein